MNQTIPLVESLLVKGRNLYKLGIQQKAFHIYEKLSGFRQLPTRATRESRLRLAALFFRKRKYRRTRRLLASLLIQEPNCAHYHYLMGRVAGVDVRLDPRLAVRHYRLALQLDPENPRYLSSFGLFALRNGKNNLALKLLRKAFQFAPTDALVLTHYLKCLRQLHRIDEARLVLNCCRFRLGKTTWFQNLHRDFEFFVLHQHQRQQRQQPVFEDTPCLLPFPESRIVLDSGGEDQSAEELPKTIRFDGPEPLAAPHLSLSLRRPDQRHAQ